MRELPDEDQMKNAASFNSYSKILCDGTIKITAQDSQPKRCEHLPY
jgi:hypothetical protein